MYTLDYKGSLATPPKGKSDQISITDRGRSNRDQISKNFQTLNGDKYQERNPLPL